MEHHADPRSGIRPGRSAGHRRDLTGRRLGGRFPPADGVDRPPARGSLGRLLLDGDLAVGNPNTNLFLEGVSGSSSSDVWAVGSGASYLWTGAGWDVMATPAPARSLNGVSGSSSTDVWAAGWGVDGTFTMHWDEAAWTEVPTPNRGIQGNSLQAIVVRTPNSAWAVGSFGGRRHWPLVEHWNGTDWHVRRTPADFTENGSFVAVTAVPGSRTVFALGRGGLVERFC